MIPRPVRNNNPFDIDAGPHWQGLMPADRLTDVQKHERFAVFATPEDGFRAGVILLHNYKKLYGANTVQKVIDRLAPPTENPTQAYAAAVCERVSSTLGRIITPVVIIDVDDPSVMFAMAKAIATDETGAWEPYWHDTQLAAGMHLAGFGAAAEVA